METKKYTDRDGLEFYIEMHIIIGSFDKLAKEFKDDAKNAALELMVNLARVEDRIDSGQKFRDLIKIRRSILKLESFFEIVKMEFNKSFPEIKEKLDDIKSESEKLIRTIDWRKINSEPVEDEDEFNEDDFYRRH